MARTTETRLLAAVLCSLWGTQFVVQRAMLSGPNQPLPCLVHRPGMTVMPIAVFQVAGLLPAPPS